MIIIGLTGGIGNALFALPTIKRFSRSADVSLVVECDYECAALFRRCSFVRKVYAYGEKLPRATRYLACYGVPSSMRGLPVELVGWPKGAREYDWPEWMQIKMSSGCGDSREDVVDWCSGIKSDKSVDFALIPCGKPGSEWARKRWDGFLHLARKLESAGHSVQAFGQSEEIHGAGLQGWWQGPVKPELLPDHIAKCRVAVSNDCGPGHLASSIGVPTLMLFTATSPIKGMPVGPHRVISTGCELAPRGCQSTSTWRECSYWKCREIPVDRVLSESIDMLVKK
jgi:ADP-heptose:LPS heptosyltransferase